MADPPSRQPLVSRSVRSREAAPTTTRSGTSALSGRTDAIDGPSYTRRASGIRSPWSPTVFFYELREGDDDIFADVLLLREEEMDADSFFELVQSIRLRVQDSFPQNTLIEAIAEELERDHDFIADLRRTPLGVGQRLQARRRQLPRRAGSGRRRRGPARLQGHLRGPAPRGQPPQLTARYLLKRISITSPSRTV